MPMPTNIVELMQGLPQAFSAQKAGSIKATIQLNLTGEGGGDWTVQIADGKCAVNQGKAESPTATVSASAADYLAIARGELNAVSAFMSGRIRVTGDMALMMNFQSWFATPS